MRLKILLFIISISLGIIQKNVAQCSILTTTNTSTLTCGIAPLSACGGVVTVGDGTAIMTLFFNANLDLTCLGPIQLVVRNNATLDFSPGNNRLTLAAGSSLILETGSNLEGGSCNASERIYIGSDLIASCNGGAGADYSFDDLVGFGGYNIVTATVTPVSQCGSGSFSILAIPIPSAGSAIKWYTVPSGGSPIFTGNPYVSPVISSTTNYYVEAYYASSGFTTPRIQKTAVINPLPATPTFGTITQPSCTLATGSVVVNSLPSGTWTLNQSGTTNATYTGSGSSFTINGLGVGNYTFTVSNGTCTSVSSANLSILSATASWNGVSWSVPPTINRNLAFNGNYSSAGNLDGCSCVVNLGSVVFNSGDVLTLQNGLNVAGGSLTFNNNSSLIQLSNASNSGNITYIRNTAPVVLRDYTYWGAPTNGFQTLSLFSPNTVSNRFHTYTNAWTTVDPSVTTFQKGIGYAIWAPQSTSPTVPVTLPHQFVGVPNNGNVDVPVVVGPPVANKLIGNPYPSTLDADAFINANIVGTGSINQTISGTLYFWTHNHRLVGNDYLQTDYATYNLSGGTAVPTGTGNTTAPTRYIAAGQGFFVTSLANGNVSFRNSMRVVNNTNNFYRNSAVSELNGKNRVWLNISRNDGATSQMLFGYIDKATNNFDAGFDGKTLGIANVEIYSLLHKEPYVIQAVKNNFNENDIVALGFKTNVSGVFKISLDKFDGLFGTQDILLEDKITNTIHDIKLSEYEFKSESGQFDNRFVLRFKKENKLTVTAFNDVKVLIDANIITVNSNNQNIKNIEIFDINGRLLLEKKNISNTSFSENKLVQNNVFLLVKIALENGDLVTKKIIF